MSKAERGKVIFYTVAAQADNLGDIEIRATLLDWLAEHGNPVVVYVGAMPKQYLEAFAAPGNVIWLSSRIAFETRFMWASVRRRSALVFAPGPQTLSNHPLALGKSLLNLTNVLLVRASGGPALAVGRSFRGSAAIAKRLEQYLVGKFDFFTVRDDVSARVLGAALQLEPDLAFAHPRKAGVPLSERQTVAVSFRGDRPVDVRGFQALVALLQAVNVDVVLVTQVKRDDAQHRELSQTFGLRSVLWENATHDAQFRRVRAAYANARFVISNRLHALLLAAQEGSMPVAMRDAQWDKTRSTLEPWLPLSSTDTQFTSRDSQSWHEVPSDEEIQDFAVAHLTANKRLSAVKRALQASLPSDA